MIYKPEKLEIVINKLSKLYDLKNVKDLFILLPQILEQVEVRAMAFGVVGGIAKKKAAINVLSGISKINTARVSKKLLSILIDTIVNASKGYYTINDRKDVINIASTIVEQNSLNLDKKFLTVFINTIIDASKGYYAINKVKKEYYEN